MQNENLLLEIGTEELPPRSLKSLMCSLEQNLALELKQAGFTFSASRGFASPRRLAVLIENLSEKQTDKQIDKRGPAIAAAYDEKGEPTRALQGFASSCGITDLSTLERFKTDKGEWVVFRSMEEGKSLKDCIESLVSSAIDHLPIERKMRWGSSRLEFVRPVHWIVILHGDNILPAVVLGHAAGRVSRGHRFMSDKWLEIQNADDYTQALQDAFVVVDFNERRQKIEIQLQAEATKLGCNLVLDNDLLDEVTSLVEWPCALAGSFDKSFLSIPDEALISAMKKHQRYFHLVNDIGELQSYFITVSNIQSKDEQVVIKGNERVIRPRLADAAFFFKQDSASTLDKKLEKLADVVFQSELGTFLDKANRISKLAEFIASQLGADEPACARAALLCKVDLITDMVDEFPDLQGIMGGYYSNIDGNPEEIGLAIREHYLPTYSGGPLPSTLEGSCVALADKLDTLVGLFAIGQPPSGSRDPFALRRQTLGILRICIENELVIEIETCLDKALELHGIDATKNDVLAYTLDRLSHWYGEKDIDHDVFDAIRFSSPGINNLLEADHRIRSMQAFRSHQQAPNLAAANKRVSNILKKVGDEALDQSVLIDPDASLFTEQAEHDLFKQMTEVSEAFAQGILNYNEKFERLACLQPFIDCFFNDVMVMAEEKEVRSNRLVLLRSLANVLLQVADFSRLEVSSE